MSERTLAALLGILGFLAAAPLVSAEVPRLTIRVIDSDTKQPVPGAHLRVTWRNDVAPAYRGREYLVKQEDEFDADAAGTVNIEIPEPFRTEATAYFEVLARGYMPSDSWRERSKNFVVTNGGDQAIEIPVEQGLVLSGTVVNVDARPIAGARVLLTLSGPGWCSWPQRYPAMPITDENGHWEISSFDVDQPTKREGSRYVITIQHPENAPAVIQSPEKQPQHDGVVALRTVMNRSEWVEGIVVGPDQRPTPGARVLALASATSDEPGCVSIESEAVADSSGHFRLGGLDTRALSIHAEHDQHAPSAPVAAAAPHDLAAPTLALTTGYPLEGRVSRPDGAPIAGLTIRLDHRAAELRRLDETDESGSFRFGGIPAGSVTLTGEDVFSRSIELPYNGTLAITSPVRRRLRVVLRDAKDDAPIAPPARVHYRGPYYSAIRDLENPNGEIEFSDLSPGTYHFYVSKEGRVVPHAAITLLDNGKQDSQLVIALRTGFSLSGRVTDLHGDPIAGATVNAAGPSHYDEHQSTTDADGRYELRGLNRRHVWAGSWYLLSVQKDGFATVIDPELFARSWPFDRKADFKLGPGGTVSGIVRNADGKAAAGVLVKLVKQSRWYSAPVPSPFAVTDQDGGFTLTGVPAESVSLYVGNTRQELKLHHAETRTLEIRLP